MDAVGFNGESDVQAVVDQQVRLITRGQRPKLLGQCVQLAAFEVLFPELNGPHPAVEGGVHDIGEGPVGGLGAVGDEIQAKVEHRSDGLGKPTPAFGHPSPGGDGVIG